MNTAGIKDLYYKPNKLFNHFLKDDLLVVSYTGKIKVIEKRNDAWDYTEYENEDERVYGTEIIDILKGAREYSGIDINPIVKAIEEKAKWLRKTYPEQFGDFKFDAKKTFSEPIYRRETLLKI